VFVLGGELDVGGGCREIRPDEGLRFLNTPAPPAERIRQRRQPSALVAQSVPRIKPMTVSKIRMAINHRLMSLERMAVLFCSQDVQFNLHIISGSCVRAGVENVL